MQIAFYGSSLVSAYWNGAATYYRGLLKNLAACGHCITFYEPDAFDRQAHRDIDPPDWCEVVVYPPTEDGLQRALVAGAGADLLVKASGVGVFDAELEARVPAMRRQGALALFLDVDAPATLDRMRRDPQDPFRAQVARYDAVVTYGGGPPVVEAYRSFGARSCMPIYNALDPDTHHPVQRQDRFACDLLLVANRLPDREARIEEFFLKPAALLPHLRFLLGGNGWHDKEMPANVRRIGHVYTADHNALNASARVVLNVNRASMASNGYSPPTRVFEAAGAGACLITDAWEGIELFLAPGHEILVARDGDEVATLLAALDDKQAHRIGARALSRLLDAHTYAHRATELDALLTALAAKAGMGRATPVAPIERAARRSPACVGTTP
jgi:spore maturation protein CgeB